VVLVLLAAAAGFAQDPDGVLARARAHLQDAAAAVPKYTCTQTVDRSYFRETRQIPKSCDAIVANRRGGRSQLVPTSTDRLRFDVEVADGGYEIYAWPGEARIENEKVEEMAGGGVLGTGPFGPFLVDIFANPAVQFQYLGERDGKLFEYRYRVPLAASHYRVQAGVLFRTTAYDGTFRLDSTSADLRQLTVRTLELPTDTASCEATTLMDFEPLRIGAGEYVIPNHTRLQVIGRDAGFTENSTVYTDCHEFRGESVVRFDLPIPNATNGPTLSVRDHAQILPPGMPVSIVLEAEIDTDRAAAGDPITARTGKPLIDPATKRVLAPAGSLIRGRITHLEHKIEGEKYFLVGLSFETLELQGAATPLAVILDAAHQIKDLRAGREGDVRITESRSGFHSGGTLIFPTRESRYVVPRGYTSNWITGQAKAARAQKKGVGRSVAAGLPNSPLKLPTAAERCASWFRPSGFQRWSCRCIGWRCRRTSSPQSRPWRALQRSACPIPG
jgi:hypothetical protein